MKAILVVSFGTSFPETRKVTIEAIEQQVADTFSEYRMYRAWTSQMIMKKILKTEGLAILNVQQAFEQMKADGVTQVIVQPTHVMNGIENDWMKEQAMTFANDFEKITFGTPLLTSQEDLDAVVAMMVTEFADTDPDTAVVLMGHGSEHYANMAYAALDYTFKQRGALRFFVGTVEAYPSLDTVKSAVLAGGYQKVMLAPLMIVAGDHANHDLVGKDPDSWYNVFKAAGMLVSYRLKGLGEYPAVRAQFIDHIKQA